MKLTLFVLQASANFCDSTLEQENLLVRIFILNGRGGHGKAMEMFRELTAWFC